MLQEAGFQLSGSAACSQSGRTGLCKLPVRPSTATAVPAVMMMGEHINHYGSSLRGNNWSLLKTKVFGLGETGVCPHLERRTPLPIFTCQLPEMLDGRMDGLLHTILKSLTPWQHLFR